MFSQFQACHSLTFKDNKSVVPGILRNVKIMIILNKLLTTETISSAYMQSTESGKIFTSSISNKKIIPRIWKKNLKKLNAKGIKLPIIKWAKRLNRQSLKIIKEEQIANTYFFKCSASLFILEKRIETTLRYHFIIVRMALIKKFTDKCWGECGKEPLFTTDEGGDYSHCGTSKYNYHMFQIVPHWAYIQRTPYRILEIFIPPCILLLYSL